MLLPLSLGHLIPIPGHTSGLLSTLGKKQDCRVTVKLVQPVKALTGLCVKVTARLLSLIVICYFSVGPPIRQDPYS